MKHFTDATSELDNIILSIEIHTEGTEDDYAESYNRFLEEGVSDECDEVACGDECDNFIDMTNKDDVGLLMRILKRTALYFGENGDKRASKKALKIMHIIEDYSNGKRKNIDIEIEFDE